MNFSPLNNDLSGVSINSPLTLLSVFVSALYFRALIKSSLVKSTLISYVISIILLMFKLLSLL